jgi:hypothetical protein
MRILALAGGGYLGLYSATALAGLEARGGEPLGASVRPDCRAPRWAESPPSVGPRGSDGSRRAPVCQSWHRSVLAARTATRQGDRLLAKYSGTRLRELLARDFAAAHSVRHCTASPRRDRGTVDPEKRPTSQASTTSHQTLRVGRRNQHSLAVVEPAHGAQVEEALDLLVDSADRLHLAVLADRAGDSGRSASTDSSEQVSAGDAASPSTPP